MLPSSISRSTLSVRIEAAGGDVVKLVTRKHVRLKGNALLRIPVRNFLCASRCAQIALKLWND